MDKEIALIALAIAAIVAVVAIFGFIQITGAAIIRDRDQIDRDIIDGGPGVIDGGPGVIDGGPGVIDGGPGVSDGGMSLEYFNTLSREEQSTILAMKGLTGPMFESMSGPMQRAILSMETLSVEERTHRLVNLAHRGMKANVFMNLPEHLQETIAMLKFGVSAQEILSLDGEAMEAILVLEGVAVHR